MSGLKKLLKKKGQKSKLSLSSENVNDAASTADGEMASVGYYIAKEKDLPKLHKAVWNGDSGKVKQILKKGDINQLDKENRTALHLACAQGNEEMARFLLTNKAKTNLCDNMGRTPLMKAVECQFRSCVEALLEYRAECNVVDINNSTPLHLAAANGDIDTAVLLIEREAKVNSQDKEGFAPLHVAASLGNQDFVMFLLNEGAALNSTDSHGRSPIMTAASEGHIGIVKVLLQHKANTDLKDTQGWKASDHAVIHGHHSVANIIDEHDEQRMQEARRTTGSGAKPAGKKGADLSSLLGTGTTDVEFSFGGPASDLGGDNSVSAKDDESASHSEVANDGNPNTDEQSHKSPPLSAVSATSSHNSPLRSDAENSWESSGDEMFEAKPKVGKPSLMAALKPVARTGSNASTHSNKASRIPVRADSVKSNASQDVKSPPDGSRSRIPIPTGSPVPPKKLALESDTQSGGTSPAKPATPFHLFTASSLKSESKIPTPEASKKTPPAKTTPTPSTAQPSPASEPSAAAAKKEEPAKSQPPHWEGASADLTLSDDNDSESEFSDSAVLAALSGNKPPPLFPTKTSTPMMAAVKKPQGAKQGNNSEIPKLNLGSSLSEVSDPDISGLSDKPRKNVPVKKEQKSKPVDDELSDGSEMSGWDSSDDILPSDEPGTGPQNLGLSSSFGLDKAHKNELQQAVSKKKEHMDKQEMEMNVEAKNAAELRAGRKSSDLFDSDEEMTETESEWEKERNEKKRMEKERMEQLQREELERIATQKQLEYEAEIERKKEDERRKEWERMEREREEALAREIQEELEREMELEKRQREEEEEEERRKQEEVKERERIEAEEKQRREDEERRRREEEDRREKEAAEQRRKEDEERRRRDEEERRKREAAERRRREEEERRKQEEKKAREEREAAERRRREEEERRKEEDAKKLKEEAERLERERREDRRKMKEELERIEREREEERRRIEQEKEEELERQMRLKEEEMMRIEKEKEEERKRNEEELRRVEREREEEIIRLAQEKEEEMERQMRLKEEEMERQKRVYQEQLEREKREWEERKRKEEEEKEKLREESRQREEEQRRRQEELLERQRQMKEEEDRLLEEYRKKQERLLEQERRFEEEMARRERDLGERGLVEPAGSARPVEEEEVVDLARETQVYAEAPQELDAMMNESGELEELKRSFEMNLEREKAALEESVRRREEEERRAEEAAQRLRHQREQLRRQEEEWRVKQQWNQQVRKEEQEARRLEEALRCKRAEEDMLQSQQKARRMQAEEEVIRSRMEIEKMQLQELEMKKNKLDQQASTKLAELSSRQRREELDQKSRQILQEREKLSATYEAARMRTSEMAQQPRPSVTSKHGSVDSELSDLDLTEEKGEESPPMRDKDKGDQNLTNGLPDVDDWSETSEEFEHGASPPGILASGVTGLNFTSPGRVQSPPMKALNSSPLKASTAVFSPLNGSFGPQDTQSLSRLQEALRDSKRQIDRLKEKNSVLELSRKKLENDINTQQGVFEALTREHKEAERAKMETEVELRNLRYKHEQESEARRVAEALLHQLKEQIHRSEEKLEKEMETRQKFENDKRRLVTENKNFQNTIQQLEADVNDLKQALTEEQEARVLQSELYNQQKKQNEVLLEESRHTAQQKSEVMYQLEAVDQTRKIHEVSSDNLREQLKKAEVSLAETKATLEATKSSLGKEIELLKEKLQKKSDKLGRAEEQLNKTKEDFDSHVATGKNEQANLSTKLESEAMTRSRMESEITSLKARLENADRELERLEKSRAEAERSSHSLRDELYKCKLKLEKEGSSLKEVNQALSMRLEAAENRASNAELELQTANVGLAERGGQLNLLQREIEQKKSQLEQISDKLAREKEQATKISAKFDTTSDRVSRIQNENDSLRSKLDDARDRSRKQEEATAKAEENFNTMLTGLRNDFEKSKQAMGEKQKNLVETIERLKGDLVRANDKHSEQEKEIKQLQQELNESTRKLASSEAALEMQIKNREDLEEERVRLREQLMDLEQRLSSAELAKDEVAGRTTRLENQLEHSLRYGDITKERLGSKQQDVESVARTLSEEEDESAAQLERVVMKLKVEKAQVEASLKEETAKCDLLMAEIRDTNEARRSLEALLSNIKSNNVELEEKVQAESLTRVQQQREANEAKALWEAEVRGRNKLGTRITDLETQVEEARFALEEEKRKTRKALEMKRSLEAKVEAYDSRSAQHQKEVVALKTQLKTYKRRMKEYESSESRIPIMRAEFDKERAAMDSHITSLRRQVEHLNERLRQEMETRSRVELTSKQQQQELSAAKSHEKNLINERDKLEQLNRRLERDLDRLKLFYENNYVEKGQLESHKQELETKTRFELNRKLEEVNAHLEEQALARDALDKLREQTEHKTKKELEQNISELKTQLAKTRAGLYEGQTQKETYEAEAKRYRDLYEGELKVKDKLSNRLSRANDKIAESKAILNFERSRRSQFEALPASPTKFATDPLNTMFRSATPTSPDRMHSRGDGQLMKAVENELSKSIKRHLDAAPAVSDLDLKPSLLNSGNELDTNPYSPLASSSRQYMSVLKKNYFV